MGSIIAFGGYDTRKPRVRLLIDAIRRAGALEEEILITGWKNVPQTNIPSRLSVLKVLAKILIGYPYALLRLVRSKSGAAILLPYPGIVEIMAIAPLARLMGRKVVLDAFLPIHDTIVGDRALLRRGILASMIWWFEKLALGCADLILVDTDQHGQYFADEFGIEEDRFVTVLVGAEKHFSISLPREPVDDVLGEERDTPIVLFYGQLIPLHGVPTILEAARLSQGLDARWIFIGRGQLEPMLRQTLDAANCDNIEWIEWVDYERLPAVIARASICLGVFGASDKAARVIPNKLFQQLAMGKPVLTRASPAVDTLAHIHPHSVITVPAGDSQALAAMVAAILSGKRRAEAIPPAALDELTPDHGIHVLLERLNFGG
jgi:glycosyltransferase involved in cell wall biosynthesis